MIKRLLPFLKPWKNAALLCPVLVLLETVADVLIPVLMSMVVDNGVAEQNIPYIIKIGGLMVGLALFAMVSGAFGSHLAAVASQGFGSTLRAALFDKIQSFSFANLDRFTTPSLVTRLTNDVNNQVQAVMMVLRMLIRAPFMLIMALIMAIIINRSLASIFLIAIPLLALSLWFIMSNAHPRFQKLQKRLDALNTAVQENLVNIRVVKVFARGDYERKRFSTANDAMMNSAIRAIRLVIMNGPIMQAIMFSCIIAILWFGGGMVSSGTLLTGKLISFIAYVTQILMSLMMLSMIFLMFTRAKASVERVLEILDETVDITEPDLGRTMVPDGSISFEQVSFRYPANPHNDVLSAINLHIRSGETIGILGPTGSGKTSFVQLIPRLYDATTGTIKIGGHDARSYQLESLRNAVGMVLQKNTLFSGTIRENLQWGDHIADDATLQRACEDAEAWSFISRLPEGLSTQLGQGGVNLSGGQKQRLCIARALLKHPKILILDDSTSAVDMATDARIQEAFQKNLTGITTIIIAQRIRSIQHANRIIVIDNGRINGVGSHIELLNHNDIYRDIFDAQQEGSMAV